MKFLIVVLAVYVVYAVAMVALHPRFIYPFAQNPFDVSGWTRPVVDGSDIRLAWHDDTGQGAVLYFMGNAGALAYFDATLNAHVAAGRPVSALEYRGGGGVAGTPSEAQLKADALDAYDWLRSVHQGPIAVHGYSMGTGLAIYVAAERDVDAIILDAPFYRMCELMARAAFLPACLLPGVQKWDSAGLVGDIDAPVLIQHGVDDTLIPMGHSERLVRLMQDAGLDVTFEALPDAGHIDLWDDANYRSHITGFLDRVAPR